jgi:hypothetical protein
MENNTCVICGAGFRNTAMKGDKCTLCAALYPNVGNAVELKQKHSKIKAETLTDVTVRKMIYDILAEAGIKRHKCEKCSALFFRTSPAQKYCTLCRNKEVK